MRSAVQTAQRLFSDRTHVDGVELGVAFGAHAASCLNQWPSLHLIGVDNYCEGGPERIAAAKEATATFSNRFRLLSLDSSFAASVFNDQFDYVYVDADHTYEGVKKDLIAWYPKVKVGGVFGGHDYANHTVPGVADAVDEFFRNSGLHITVDPHNSDWWVIKPNEERTAQ